MFERYKKLSKLSDLFTSLIDMDGTDRARRKLQKIQKNERLFLFSHSYSEFLSTLLDVSILKNKIDFVKLFIEFGAPIDGQALYKALTNDRIEIFKFFVDNVKEDFKIPDNIKDTKRTHWNHFWDILFSKYMNESAYRLLKYDCSVKDYTSGIIYDLFEKAAARGNLTAAKHIADQIYGEKRTRDTKLRLFHNCLRGRNIELARYILGDDRPRDCIDYRLYSYDDIVIGACYNIDKDFIVFLVEIGMKLDVVIGDTTPLTAVIHSYQKHKSDREKRIGLTDTLLKGGVNVNRQIGSYRSTALLEACEEREVEIVEFLLSHGADPNIKSYRGGTAPDCFRTPLEHIKTRINRDDKYDKLSNMLLSAMSK
jgi:hypothetical protein